MTRDENKPADPKLFAQLLDNQRYELALKEKEIDLEREKAQAAKEIDRQQFIYAQPLSRPLKADDLLPN